MCCDSESMSPSLSAVDALESNDGCPAMEDVESQVAIEPFRLSQLPLKVESRWSWPHGVQGPGDCPNLGCSKSGFFVLGSYSGGMAVVSVFC